MREEEQVPWEGFISDILLFLLEQMRATCVVCLSETKPASILFVFLLLLDTPLAP